MHQQAIVDDHIDGLGAITQLAPLCGSPPETERTIYFGTSSTVNFVKQVHQILSEADAGIQQDARSSDLPKPKRRHGRHGSGRDGNGPKIMEEYAIPTRGESESMLASFWTRTYPLYPFLNRSDFDESYRQLWTPPSHNNVPASMATADDGDSGYHEDPGQHRVRVHGDGIPESRRFHVLLNIMYALGCLSSTSKHTTTQAERAQFYWRRCKDLLERDFDIFNRPRTRFIQAVLYMSVYMQSTEELTSASWNLSAIAIRMSQALGLHCAVSNRSLDPARLKLLSVRAQTWAGCVVMDR
jgi:hypothetical protein